MVEPVIPEQKLNEMATSQTIRLITVYTMLLLLVSEYWAINVRPILDCFCTCKSSVIL